MASGDAYISPKPRLLSFPCFLAHAASRHMPLSDETLIVTIAMVVVLMLPRYFIDHTIRAEQQDYEEEGVEWEHVDYFNNKVSFFAFRDAVIFSYHRLQSFRRALEEETVAFPYPWGHKQACCAAAGRVYEAIFAQTSSVVAVLRIIKNENRIYIEGLLSCGWCIRASERTIPCDGIVCSARQPREQTWLEKIAVVGRNVLRASKVCFRLITEIQILPPIERGLVFDTAQAYSNRWDTNFVMHQVGCKRRGGGVQSLVDQIPTHRVTFDL